MKQDFVSLYDQYFDDVYRYIYFKTGSSWDTDDLVSDTFRKAFEKFATVRDNPKSWLFSIARNTVTDHYRRKKELAVGEDIELYTYPCWQEDNLEKKEELNCLKKSLQALSKEELEIVNLKYFAGLKMADIGQLTGKTANAVKMKSMRVVQKLKELVTLCLEG